MKLYKLESGVIVNLDAIEFIRHSVVPVSINTKNGDVLQCMYNIYTRNRESIPATETDVKRISHM